MPSKNNTIHIRVSESEYCIISQKAAEVNMTISEFARYSLIAGESSADMKRRIFGELSLMCNSINRCDELLSDEYPELCKSLKEGINGICLILK